MPRTMDPFRFVLIAVAGWMNQRQSQAVDYLREENRVLREQLGGQRLNDDQRRRLAAKAKGLGREILAEVATTKVRMEEHGVENVIEIGKVQRVRHSDQADDHRVDVAENCSQN